MVSADGKAIVPEQSFVIYQFTATSAASPGGTPSGDPPGCQDLRCQCMKGGKGGDPVSCHDGLFLESATDLKIADTLPLALERTYRTKDVTQRTFGVGASHSYGLFLSFINQVGYTADGIELNLASGGRIPFMTTGSKYYHQPDAIYESNVPGEFYKARIQYSTVGGSGFMLTFRDGRRYGFTYYSSKLKWMEDRYGNRVTLTRDGSSRISSLISPNGRWIEFEYTATSCTTCITKATDNAGRMVSYTYDTNGRLFRVTDPEAGVTEYGYDASHRMTTVKDARGNFKVTNEFDANGRVKKQTYADNSTNQFAYTLDANSKVVQTDVTRERGDVRRIEYDGAGNITRETLALSKPEQQIRIYTYNTAGLLETETDPLGRVTRHEYDTVGNRTKVTKMYGTAEAVSWTYTYEPTFNQVKTVTDPLGHVTSYSYDTKGKLTQIKDALNHLTDITYNSAGRPLTLKRYAGSRTLTTTFGYDGGDLVSVIDPLGRTTTMFPDSLGRMVTVKNPLGHVTRTDRDKLDRVTATTDAQGNVVRYGYDANGNLLTFTDAKDHVTAWTSDSRNRLLTKQDALLKTESYAYDAAGNLAFVTDRKGQVTGYEYDFLNRRTKASFGATSTSSPVYQNSITYTWDSADRLTQLADTTPGAGTITRTYDNRFDTLKTESGPEGTVSYAYYADGRRQSVTPGGGSATSYVFDAAGRLTGITQAAGTSAGTPTVAQSVAIDYDEADRRESVRLPNGIEVSYAYDDASQLTGITYRKSDGTLIGDLSYQYDAAGRRTTIGGSLARTTLPAAVASATYDANNRLTNWGGLTLDYDDNGNLIREGTTTYGWNARNQLEATSQGAASFAYDAAGRRRSRTVSGTSLQTLYDGWNALQLKQGGATTETRLFGLGLDDIYGRTANRTSQSFPTDALGSVLQVTAGDQSLIVNYTYGPYGQTSDSPAGASSNLVRYTGREQDTANLYYYRNRYYSTGTDRFISEDPIGLAGGFNAYSYVKGNPLAYSDPLGWAGHKKGARPSTLGKHQEGDARRGRDQGGEKGDANRGYGRQKPPDHKGPWPPKPEPEPEPDDDSGDGGDDSGDENESQSSCGQNCQAIPKVIFSALLGVFIVITSWLCF